MPTFVVHGQMLDEDGAREEVHTKLFGRLSVSRLGLPLFTLALGIIDAHGDLISRQLPPDMLPESDTTVETG